jgi:hypothetical protein
MKIGVSFDTDEVVATSEVRSAVDRAWDLFKFDMENSEIDEDIKGVIERTVLSVINNFENDILEDYFPHE